MFENQRTNEKRRAPEHTNTKITKKTSIRCPLKLDVDAPAWTGALFSLFDRWCRKSSKCIPKASDMDARMGLRTKKVAEEMFIKHVQTYQKNKIHSNGYPNCKAKSLFLFMCLRSPAKDEVQGVPGQAPRSKSMLKWRPWDRFPAILFQWFHTLWRHFGDDSSIPWTTHWSYWMLSLWLCLFKLGGKT